MLTWFALHCTFSPGNNTYGEMFFYELSTLAFTLNKNDVEIAKKKEENNYRDPSREKCVQLGKVASRFFFLFR